MILCDCMMKWVTSVRQIVSSMAIPGIGLAIPFSPATQNLLLWRFVMMTTRYLGFQSLAFFPTDFL